MESVARHQCLVYEGPPSRQLPALVAMTRLRLRQNLRCLYLNSPTMVAGMRSYLAASGIDVAGETAQGSLILSSEQNLVNGCSFNPQQMIDSLKSALDDAIDDGYSGLWATGDMAWEFGPQKDFSQLMEYEWLLEEFMRANPEICGICQYRADMLPRKTMRQGLLSHTSIFVNETLSLVNPQYVDHEKFSREAAEDPCLDSFVNELIAQES